MSFSFLFKDFSLVLFQNLCIFWTVHSLLHCFLQLLQLFIWALKKIIILNSLFSSLSTLIFLKSVIMELWTLGDITFFFSISCISALRFVHLLGLISLPLFCGVLLSILAWGSLLLARHGVLACCMLLSSFSSGLHIVWSPCSFFSCDSWAWAPSVVFQSGRYQETLWCFGVV